VQQASSGQRDWPALLLLWGLLLLLLTWMLVQCLRQVMLCVQQQLH
jgi:hypothetical protein